MIKILVTASILIAPAAAFAQTVSNTQYIEKKIKVITEETDQSYDEIKNIFNKDRAYTTICFQKTPENLRSQEGGRAGSEFEEIMPIPRAYLHTFKLAEHKLGFDLSVDVSAQDLSEEEVFGRQIYGLSNALTCAPSEKGCSNFYLDAPKLTIVSGDEENKVELTKSWNFYIESEELLYAEYTIRISTSKRNFLGAKTGTEDHEETYRCVMELLEEI